MAEPPSVGSGTREPQPATGGLNFEGALERLEGVVARLESGELSLEDALAAFEEGVQLSRHCSEQLGAAERKIEILVEQGDGIAVRPFGASDGPGGDES